MPVAKFDRAEIEEQAKIDATLNGYSTKWKPDKGDNEVRIIPARPGGKVKHVVGTHWNVWDNGIDRGSGKNLNCPKAADKTQPCYLCAIAADLLISKNATDKNIGNEMRCKYAFLYNVLDLSDIDAGIQVASFGSTINDAITKLFLSKYYKKGITDTEAGHAIVITKTEKNKKVSYSVTVDPEPSALPDSILDLLDAEDPPDLTNIYAIATDAAMRAAWEGVDLDDDKEEPTQKVEVKRRASSTRRAADPEPETDEPDELPFEAEPPSRTRASAKVVEPEDLDNGDDDEEDGDDTADKAVAVGRRLGERAAARRRQ